LIKIKEIYNNNSEKCITSREYRKNIK